MEKWISTELLDSECEALMVPYIERHHMAELEKILEEMDSSESKHHGISVRWARDAPRALFTARSPCARCVAWSRLTADGPTSRV